MPLNVRNFWIETRTRNNGEYDNYRDVSSGPIGKLGTFTTTIKIREAGQVADAITVEGFADDDGTLTINVFAEGSRVFRLERKR